MNMTKRVRISISGPPNSGKTSVFTIITDALLKAGIKPDISDGGGLTAIDGNGFEHRFAGEVEEFITQEEARRRLARFGNVNYVVKTYCEGAT